MKLLLLIGAFCVSFTFAEEETTTTANGTDSKVKNIRRQVPAYAAPLYAPRPLFAAPPPPPLPLFAAPAGYALPAPAPIPVAPGPAFLPPPPPPPMYQPPPPPQCAPACIGNAACISGACACPAPIAYSPVVGCAPLPPPPPPPPVPVVTGRLIPQALPGAPCEPGVECTGGSVCSMGICLCPPELVQEGTVCVSRTIYGIVPPPPPPPVYVPAPMPVFAAPVAVPAPPPVALAPPPCPPQYVPYNNGCVRRKHARKEATSEEKPEEQ